MITLLHPCSYIVKSRTQSYFAKSLETTGPFFQINLESSMVTDDNFDKVEEESVVGGKIVKEKKKSNL